MSTRQVIIKIRDLKGKLRATQYYYCSSDFSTEAPKYIKENMFKGCEIQIKVGNQYSSFYSYEELQELAKEDNIEVSSVIYGWLNSPISSVKYYVENYLPKY